MIIHDDEVKQIVQQADNFSYFAFVDTCIDGCYAGDQESLSQSLLSERKSPGRDQFTRHD